MKALSIVFGFRDRDLLRVERCLASLTRQTVQDFEVLFVDYGSRPELARGARRVVERYDFARYIYTETRGYPWNRSHAVNIGGKLATGAYLLTNDVDMVFADNTIEALLAAARPDREVHVSPHWLPREFDDWEHLTAYRRTFKRATRAGRGICLLPRAVFQELRGYDEYYRYYGVEDRDLSARLRLAGLEEHWLDTETAMYHQWHPDVNYNDDAVLPEGVWGRLQIHYHARQDAVQRNADGWGELHTPDDRPVFRFVDVDRQLLRQRDDLRLLDVPPDQNQSVAVVGQAFFAETEPGGAVAIDHAFFPKRTAGTDAVLQKTNWLLRFLRREASVGYPTNKVHSFVALLVAPPARGVADYYLALPINNGVSVLVRK
ncbi:MAG: glycosyltransferase [bacterium]